MLAAAVAAFAVASLTFKPDGAMPASTAARDCGGANRSPELHWSHAPQGARSFAVIMHDPDAPVPGGFYHWALYDVNSHMHRLPAGFNNGGYYGPCPPPGNAHHYHVTVYALDESWIETRGGRLDGPALLARIRGHVLGQASIVGTYQRR